MSAEDLASQLLARNDELLKVKATESTENLQKCKNFCANLRAWISSAELLETNQVDQTVLDKADALKDQIQCWHDGIQSQLKRNRACLG